MPNDLRRLFEASINTFILSETPCEYLSERMPFARYTLSHSARTECLTAASDAGAVLIVGYCVDARNELNRDAVPAYLLGGGADADSAVARTRRLAGKYVILLWNDRARALYAIPDASASLPLYYHTEAPVCLSSMEFLIAGQFGLRVSVEGEAVIRGQDNLIFPGDMTEYARVKCVLPNHYLNASSGASVRFFPSGDGGDVLSADEAAALSVPLIRGIVSNYAARGPVVCPLTGGWDSRLVLAFLLDGGCDIVCYTTRHLKFTDQSGDVWVPAEIARRFSIPYQVIRDELADQALIDAAREIFIYTKNLSLNTAATHKMLFDGRYRAGSDIIDQIGKSSIGGVLPEWMATASYFHCKTHNFSREARRETAKWLKEAKRGGANVSSYDLFAQEIRLGRWAAKTGSVLSFLGVEMLNVFNCQELIELWMRVPREERIARGLHKALFRRLNPALMEIPFNPGNIASEKKSNPWFLWLGTYAKYGYTRLRWRLGR